HRRTAIAVEMTQRPQIAFLHRVLGIGDVAHRVMRKREEVVEMRQRGVAKTPRSVMLVLSITPHRIALGRPKNLIDAGCCSRLSITAQRCRPLPVLPRSYPS